jgi:tryptophanyl-tRNA synthetase
MSKSLDNAILLSDTDETVQQRVMKVYTDPNRLRATDPGTIEGNVAFVYHDLFNPDRAEVADLKERYVAGKVGDVEVKKKLAAALNAFLEPMRERRARFEAQPDLIDDVIDAGNRRMGEVARETMERVREAMGLTYFRRASVY